jgi:uncharacterized DUF497 family protein
MLRFEWDERKIGAIGSSMECGLKKLKAPSAIRMHASSMIQNTQRKRIGFILIGVSSTARPLVVIHSYKESDSVIRIISARKATKKEFIFYEEGI